MRCGRQHVFLLISSTQHPPTFAEPEGEGETYFRFVPLRDPIPSLLRDFQRFAGWGLY